MDLKEVPESVRQFEIFIGGHPAFQFLNEKLSKIEIQRQSGHVACESE